MRNLINLLIMAAIVVATCWGCSPRAFTGEISHVSGDTACLPSKCFLLLPNAPKTSVGRKAVFVWTRGKSKVNCKLLK